MKDIHGITDRLWRLLDALEAELLKVSDAELTEALAELGMKPEMKGSGALADITHRLPDIFGTAREEDTDRDSVSRAPSPQPTRQRD